MDNVLNTQINLRHHSEKLIYGLNKPQGGIFAGKKARFILSGQICHHQLLKENLNGISKYYFVGFFETHSMDRHCYLIINVVGWVISIRNLIQQQN